MAVITAHYANMARSVQTSMGSLNSSVSVAGAKLGAAGSSSGSSGTSAAGASAPSMDDTNYLLEQVTEILISIDASLKNPGARGMSTRAYARP